LQQWHKGELKSEAIKRARSVSDSIKQFVPICSAAIFHPKPYQRHTCLPAKGRDKAWIVYD
jgi:hypothetical protein